MKEPSRTLVVLSTVDWNFLWQRHQVISSGLARRGWRVIFVQGLSGAFDYRSPAYYMRVLRKLKRVIRGEMGEAKQESDRHDGVTLLNCAVAPLEPRFFRWINAVFFVPRLVRMLRGFAVGEVVLLNYHPTETARQIAEQLRPRVRAYDCVMNYESADHMPSDVVSTERWWLEESDIVFVDSSYLREKHSAVRSDMVQVPPGVAFELFEMDAQPRKSDVSEHTYSRVGYFGGMGDGWFDFDLVEGLAEGGCRVVLIGSRLSEHPVFGHPNVTYVSAVEQRDLPKLIEPLDVLIMPYRINSFTMGVFPSKVFECLATGKPVISTRLPDLVGNLENTVYFADDSDEFLKIISELPRTETSTTIAGRIGIARQNSWSSRLDEIESQLDSLLDPLSEVCERLSRER